MHNREMAHRHPSLPDICEVCRMQQPMARLPRVEVDDSITLELVAAGVALACVIAGIAWLVLAAFR